MARMVPSRSHGVVLTMRVLVCGGRGFNDVREMVAFLDSLDKQTPISLIIQGGASGADAMAATWVRQWEQRR